MASLESVDTTTAPHSAGPDFVSHETPLYVLFCPCGVEEVARAELELVADRVLFDDGVTDGRFISFFSAPAAVQGLGPPLPTRPPRIAPTPEQRTAWQQRRRQKQRDREEDGPSHDTADVTTQHDLTNPEPLLSPEEATQRLRGAVFFRLKEAVWTSSRVARLFLSLYRWARSVDLCAVHVFSTPCRQRVAELDAAVSNLASHMRHTVLNVVGKMRAAMGQLPKAGVLGEQLRLLGPSYTQALTDASVLFRVNSVRRDKSVKCAFTSQDLSAQLGEQLMARVEPLGWRVSMIYHNVQIFALHDAHVAHVCVALSPPALPRGGAETGVADVDVSAQFLMEHVRQRLTRGLLDGVYSAAALKACIPRPSSTRAELRRVKGDNAMHPPLARALIAYAAILPGMVVLDPFVGSGALLVETVAHVWQQQYTGGAACAKRGGGLLLLGAELSRKDAERTARNLVPSHLLELGAVNGLWPLPMGRDEPSGTADTTCLSAWVTQTTEDAAAMDLPAALKVGQPLHTTDAQEAILAAATRTLLSGSEGAAMGGYVFTVIHADATRMPVRSNTVDRILTDMPFGRRCGSHGVNRRLYPSFLRECYRVLRSPSTPTAEVRPWLVASAAPNRLHRVRDVILSTGSGVGPGRAVLLTIEGRLLYESLDEVRAECPFQLVTEPFALDMGGLFPYVFILDKL